MRWGTEKEEGIRRKEGEWKGEEGERGRGRGGEYEEDKKKIWDIQKLLLKGNMKLRIRTK